MRVLLLQGDVGHAVVNAAVLKSAGFVVDQVPDLDSAFSFLNQYDYAIAVLDRATRETDGCGTVTRLRARGFDTPVLMLSGAASSDLTVRALRSGADDVMTGTFKADELVARIEAIVRRSNGHGQSMLHVGPLTMDMSAHDANVHGRPLRLTRKEFAVLQLLVLRRGKVLSKQQILDYLYDGLDDPDIGVIGVYICNLRKKLAEHGAGALIDTVRGCGFVMRATEVAPAAGAPSPNLPADMRLAA